MSLMPICQFPEAYADNAERESKSIIPQPNHAKNLFHYNLMKFPFPVTVIAENLQKQKIFLYIHAQHPVETHI